jgi:hypothetical protein
LADNLKPEKGPDYLAMDNDSEKRAFERRTCTALILYSYFNQKPSYDASIRNYGAGGMCFQTSHFVRPGATVCIRLKQCQPFGSLEDNGKSLRCMSLAEVKWCNEEPGDGSTTYSVGVKYQPPDY